MPPLAEFLDTLLRGLLAAGISLAVGGVAWYLHVLRPWRPAAPAASVRRCLALVAGGAAVVAAGQSLVLAIRALVLADSLGARSLADLAGTTHFEAGAARVGLALCLCAGALRLRAAPDRRGRGAVVIALAGLLAVSGAWLTHASGRLDDRPALMALTAVHQVAAAVWAGGLAQLAACWRLARREPDVDARWPEMVGRFSGLAMGSVVVILASAVPLVQAYVGDASGLVGTGYGALVLTKAALVGAALILAALNRAAVRAMQRDASDARADELPLRVEGEIMIVGAVLLTAVTLSALPPSVDVAPPDRASPGDVVEVFRPKVPTVETPSLDAMRRNRTAEPGAGRSADAYRWSNYSHNVAGLILLAMSLAALAGSVRPEVGRYWPLGFLGLAAFVYLRASANEGTWPYGSLPPWAVEAEGMQHRIAAALVLGLGAVEWRARARPRGGLGPYVFPAIAAAGAVLLLTHSHAAFQAKASYLVQVTHTTMGALAVIVAVGRWLELRLDSRTGRLAGIAAHLAMLAIALILVFYREANVVISSGLVFAASAPTSP